MKLLLLKALAYFITLSICLSSAGETLAALHVSAMTLTVACRLDNMHVCKATLLAKRKLRASDHRHRATISLEQLREAQSTQHIRMAQQRNPFAPPGTMEEEEPMTEVPQDPSETTIYETDPVDLPNTTPLTSYTAQSYKVTGILTTPDTAIGIIQEPMSAPPPVSEEGVEPEPMIPGAEHLVEPGDLLGNRGGIIENITLEGVLVIQGESEVLLPLAEAGQ